MRENQHSLQRIYERILKMVCNQGFICQLTLEGSAFALSITLVAGYAEKQKI